jgi:PAS domain S-box-containing protein
VDSVASDGQEQLSEVQGGADDDVRRSYRAILDFLPEVIFESDRQGLLVWVNRAGCCCTGLSIQDLDLGLKTFELLALCDRERAAKDLDRLMSGKIVERADYSLLCADGTPMPVQARFTVMVRNGHVAGLLGVMEARTPASDGAHSRERPLDALSATQEICHEFCQPLQVINGHADMLLMNEPESGDMRYSIERIKASVDRIGHLVQKLRILRKLHTQQVLGGASAVRDPRRPFAPPGGQE